MKGIQPLSLQGIALGGIQASDRKCCLGGLRYPYNCSFGTVNRIDTDHGSRLCPVRTKFSCEDAASFVPFTPFYL